MSVYSGAISANPILKSTIKSRVSSVRTPKVRFQLPHTKKVRHILKSFVKGKDHKDYENLVLLLRDAEVLDEDVVGLLTEATECISLLGPELRLFVDAVLSLKWTHRNKKVIEQYQSFLCNLLSAHNYHARFAIEKLVCNFLPDPADGEWPDGVPTDEDLHKCLAVHTVLNIIVNLLPLCKNMLLEFLINYYPYFKKPAHTHEYYVHNLLWVIDYLPQFRPDILHLIFTKLVLLDVNAPRDEITFAERDITMDDEMFLMDDFNPEKPADENKNKHPLAHTLDICLDKLLNYFIIECHENMELSWVKTKSLYHHMIVVFDKIILPTYNIHHVQFVMFYLCSFKSAISEAFLNYLWKKVCTPNVASVIRQTAVAYIASLVARAKFIPLSMVKGTLQQMAEWIHSYIGAQDSNEYVNSDIRVHAPFYSTCQALFYIVAFRHKDLLNTKRDINFMASLSMGKMVTCRLNPLRVCQPAVVQNFAAVTRTYQLAYCYSVIEHNSRNFLPTMYQDEKGSVLMTNNLVDAFFPFDPYVLKRSGPKIHEFYIDYQINFKDAEKESAKDCDIDDFLVEHEVQSTPKSRFSYCSSPGFKQ